jgi:hypothetical protein
MDVKRTADLHAQGRTLRQIGAELGVTANTVSQHFVVPLCATPVEVVYLDLPLVIL